VAKFFHGLSSRMSDQITFDFAPVNGHLGLLMRNGGRIETVFVIESIDGQAQTIRAIRNPDKLARIN